MNDLAKRLRLDWTLIFGGCVGTMLDAADRIEKLEAALRSIAKNTCCDRCQEAALVARAALEGKE